MTWDMGLGNRSARASADEVTTDDVTTELECAELKLNRAEGEVELN